MNQPTPTPKIPDDINYRILSADGCYELTTKVAQATHNTGWQPIGGIAILPPNPNEAHPGDPYPPVYFQAIYKPEQPTNIQPQQPTPTPHSAQPSLSACPFCLNTNQDVYRRDNHPTYKSTIYYVTCPDCGAHGPDCFTENAARINWNRRPAPPTNSTSRVEAQWEAIAQRAYTTLANPTTAVSTAIQLYEGILRYESGERTATLYDLMANT